MAMEDMNENDLDDTVVPLLSSSSEDSDDDDNEKDYLTQLEDSEHVKDWWRAYEDDNSPQSRKRKRTGEEATAKHDDEDSDASDSGDDDDNKNTHTKKTLRDVEQQSTSGLDLERVRESHLFREYRVIGLVCDEVPICYQRLGDSFFIGASIGRSFQVYEGKKLRLRLSAQSAKRSGGQHQQRIAAMCMRHELTFLAVGATVEVWYRVRRVAVIRTHTARVYLVKLVGDLLLTVGEDRLLLVWDMKRLLNRKFDVGKIVAKNAHLVSQPLKRIDFRASHNAHVDEADVVACVVHPPTYLNKIVVGFTSGKLQLWNINKCQCIFTFARVRTRASVAQEEASGARNVPGTGVRAAAGVTCMEASPVLHVVAIGFSDGLIVVHNLRTDTTVMRFEHHRHQRVNDLAFRSDGVPYLVSVANDGNIAVWNLKQRKLENMHYHAHQQRIVSAQFVDGENVLLTSSTDNALKMWLFDDEYQTGKMRLLKQRCGHAGVPNLCRFHGKMSLLSTGDDGSLRLSWIQRDVQCVSFGQSQKHVRHHFHGEANRITDLQVTPSKSRFWSNVCTVHRESNKVFLWSTARLSLHSKMLLPCMDARDPRTSANVSAVAISKCGHFAYVGRVSGALDQYNLESALHRRHLNQAHSKRVLHLFLSLFNHVLISVSADNLVKFWNLNSMQCQHCVTLLADNVDRYGTIAMAAYDAHSDLLAVATDALRVHLFDAFNGHLIRVFDVSGSRTLTHVTALLLSPQCQWLLVATMDGCVAVFDIAAAVCVDRMRFAHAVTSMSFAANGTFLATTHCNTRGIHLWANKHHFGHAFVRDVGAVHAVDMDMVKEEEPKAVPGTFREHAADDSEEDDDSDDEDDLYDILEYNQTGTARDEDDDKHGTTNDDDDGLPEISALHLGERSPLITLSSSPQSAWKNLAHWDVISQRNRASVKVRKNVENIPFFIPTAKQNTAAAAAVANSTDDADELEAAAMMADEALMTQMRRSAFTSDHKKQRLLAAAASSSLRSPEFVFDAAAFDRLHTNSKLVYLIKSQPQPQLPQYEHALQYLLGLSAASADAEIHSIALVVGHTLSELQLVLEFFIDALESNRNFEHVQSLLAQFLKVHCDLMVKYAHKLKPLIGRLHALSAEKWSDIQPLFQSNLCLVQFYSHLQ